MLRSLVGSEMCIRDSFSAVLTIQLFDMVLWSFLAWYLDKVVKQEFGLSLPWYFIFQPSYWRGTRVQEGEGTELPDRLCDDHDVSKFGNDIEPVSEEVAGRPCVWVNDLHKTFRANSHKQSSRDKVAVAGVSLSMYNGQIFALLGHNGAGKSTLISMMCGLISSSKGTCQIFGRDISAEKAAARKDIGFCPQHNILIDTLTVKEHVELFCAIKGVPAHEISGEVADRLGEVGLLDKQDNLVKQLSGGMQRKLSVAISLAAGSRFVILDEPTAGMDPVSRRTIWEVLQRNCRQRTILLTTHFMDEADLLGDRICILAGGKVRTCGSSLFLKNKFGLGYYLCLLYTSDAADEEDSVDLGGRRIIKKKTRNER
eukprot:TRINITY_DN60372_c0_g1_i1.p1 TRINITY_DN60372_c0_g1~~TRINITY_DN60372_c0_g1_i1.p1  ORF type:complete len:370 (+),score=97.42 TRINITY_DN60372_c0_g1_i1:136-1245(+)